MRLTEPGIYALEDLGGDVNNYYRDPAPEPSLNQTLAKELLGTCAKAAWHAHPRLNPAYEPSPASAAQDRGTVAHLELTGKGRGFRVIEAADYRSKAAQAERDAYRALGVIPIVRPHYEEILCMIEALRAILPDIDGGTPFNAAYGEMEACALARDPAGCWLRCLIDFYGYRCPEGVTLWDYKTVSGSANPYAITAHASVNGWALQAAFQDRILTTLKPSLGGKISYKFLVQEACPPYLCSVVTPSPGAFSMAQAAVEHAVQLWAQCLIDGRWPGYPVTAIDFGLLPSVEARWTALAIESPAPLPPPPPAPGRRRTLRHARPKAEAPPGAVSILPNEDP